MQKIYFLPIILLVLSSCNSIKIKELDIDATQELIGKVKQMEVITFRYPTDEKDTIIEKDSSVFYFDLKNKIVKEIDCYLKFKYETDFNYKNNLLESQVSKIRKRNRKVEYKYDKKSNVIEYNQLENDTLKFRKTSVYDKQNNPLERTYFHPSYKSNNSISKYSYDYKSRTINIQSFDENNLPSNHYLKYFFNKKGYIIKTETIYTDSNKGYTRNSILEYDKLGNVNRIAGLDEDGKMQVIIEYKNICDKKGNIIIREKYWKKKLIEKRTFKITYR
jgi:hypothetical protein